MNTDQAQLNQKDREPARFRFFENPGLYFIFFVGLTFLNSCQSGAQKQSPEGDTHLTQNSPNPRVVPIDSDLASYYLREIVEHLQGDSSISINETSLQRPADLRAFYDLAQMKPVWTDTIRLNQAIELLDSSATDGLSPSDYHLNEIKILKAELLKGTTTDYQKLALLDALTTDGMLLYSDNLLHGKLDPVTFEPTWNFGQRTLSSSLPLRLFNALKQNYLAFEIDSLRPQNPLYARMRYSLARYRKLKRAGGWNRIQVNLPKFKLEPGQSDSLIPQIRKRLQIEGDLNDIVTAANDSLYNSQLVKAVKHFQMRHGLNEDGVISSRTLQALNTPVDSLIQKIEINMERARWVLHELGETYVLINIAQARMVFQREGKIVFSTRAVIGKKYLQTPVFTANMQYMEFNPAWTVPYSIATKEILPQLRKGADYLTKNHMVLMNSKGEQINPSSISFSKYNAQNFPFVVRQQPGDFNSLGRVKFLFPNKYSVYMHDTPSKNYFAREDRTLSHGCIRVENPREFAYHLLNDSANWSLAKIDSVIATQKTLRVNLPQPIPVLVLYATHYTSSDSTAWFFRDFYNRDARIDSGLQNLSLPANSSSSAHGIKKE